MWAYALWVQKWWILLWIKWRYRYLPNVIVALQPLKKNFSEFCSLFSYQVSLRILILCLCNKQLISFRNMFLKGPLGLFFNAESFFFQCRKHSTVAATNTTLHVVNHHATRGYIAYHVRSAIKELWRNAKDTQKRTYQLFIYFILTKYSC